MRRLEGGRLVIATGNAGKLEEMRELLAPRGVKGHGYDPIFVPEGQDRTFAEMTHDEKNALSHRGRSIRAFEAACLG